MPATNSSESSYLAHFNADTLFIPKIINRSALRYFMYNFSELIISVSKLFKCYGRNFNFVSNVFATDANRLSLYIYKSF